MSTPDNVVPLQAGGAPAGAWDNVEVRLPPPRPRIAPGVYQARSAALTMFEAFGRRNIELGFDVFEGEATDGVVLARVPHFIRYSRKPLSPNSRLSRLLYLLGLQPTRHTKINLSVLRGKLWSVEVDDAGKDSTDKPLSPGLAYSVITRVISCLSGSRGAS